MARGPGTSWPADCTFLRKGNRRLMEGLHQLSEGTNDREAVLIPGALRHTGDLLRLPARPDVSPSDFPPNRYGYQRRPKGAEKTAGDRHSPRPAGREGETLPIER